MLYEQEFLLSLLLTLAVELPIVLVFVKYVYKYREVAVSKIIFVGFIASALTLAYFWFILPAFIFERSLYIIVGELLVIFTEAIIYNQLLKIKLFKSLVISFTANSFSMLLGTLI